MAARAERDRLAASLDADERAARDAGRRAPTRLRPRPERPQPAKRRRGLNWRPLRRPTRPRRGRPARPPACATAWSTSSRAATPPPTWRRTISRSRTGGAPTSTGLSAPRGDRRRAPRRGRGGRRAARGARGDAGGRSPTRRARRAAQVASLGERSARHSADAERAGAAAASAAEAADRAIRLASGADADDAPAGAAITAAAAASAAAERLRAPARAGIDEIERRASELSAELQACAADEAAGQGTPARCRPP